MEQDCTAVMNENKAGTAAGNLSSPVLGPRVGLGSDPF